MVGPKRALPSRGNTLVRSQRLLHLIGSQQGVGQLLARGKRRLMGLALRLFPIGQVALILLDALTHPAAGAVGVGQRVACIERVRVRRSDHLASVGGDPLQERDRLLRAVGRQEGPAHLHLELGRGRMGGTKQADPVRQHPAEPWQRLKPAPRGEE